MGGGILTLAISIIQRRESATVKVILAALAIAALAVPAVASAAPAAPGAGDQRRPPLAVSVRLSQGGFDPLRTERIDGTVYYNYGRRSPGGYQLRTAFDAGSSKGAALAVAFTLPNLTPAKLAKIKPSEVRAEMAALGVFGYSRIASASIKALGRWVITTSNLRR